MKAGLALCFCHVRKRTFQKAKTKDVVKLTDRGSDFQTSVEAWKEFSVLVEVELVNGETFQVVQRINPSKKKP